MIENILMITTAVIIGTVIANIISGFLMSQGAANVPLGPKPAIADLLAELNMLVSLECVALIDVPQSVKAIPLITDFQEIQTELIHNVLESLSSRMWMEFNRAGIKKKYVITYVTRRAHAEILTFMESNNFSLRDDSNKYLDAVQGNKR